MTFEQTQQDVAELKKGQSLILSLLQNKGNQQPEIETPLDIKETSIFIKKTVPTIYGYCQRNEIPFIRKGNKLYFLKSRLLIWLQESEVKTIAQIEIDADTYLSKKKNGSK